LRISNPVAFILYKVSRCLLAMLLISNAASVYAAESDTPAPFAAGEKLVFRVEWNPPWYLFFLPSVEAGDAELQLAQELDYKGEKALKIVFKARSSGALVRLVGLKVDDTFEYITNAKTFCTFTAMSRVREGRRKRDIEVVYLPESDRLHIHDVDVAVVPNKVRKDTYKDNVPKCVRDLFSALYWVRYQDFQVGTVRSSVVGTDDTVKEVKSVVEKKEVVITPIGKFEAWRLNTMAILGSLFKAGGQFRFWLTADERRLPVQFEARVQLGKVTGKLKRAVLPPASPKRPSAADKGSRELH
jgi:hypothetical protein